MEARARMREANQHVQDRNKIVNQNSAAVDFYYHQNHNLHLDSRTTMLLASRFSSVFAARAARPATSSFLRSFASVGDSLPSVELHQGFPPKQYNLADFAKDKSILLVGLPGAFTPT